MEEKAYRIYMSDSMRIIAENMAKHGNGGTYLQRRYLDIIDPRPQDTRSCEEITADIVARCGLAVKK